MSDETTTEMLAKIEGQAADYTPPEGWRKLQEGEVLEDGDQIVHTDDGKRYPTYRVGDAVGAGQRYIRRIEPQPEPIITPDDVAAEDLRQKLETTEAALLEQQQRNEELVTEGSRQHIEIAELQAQVAFLKNRELTLGTRLEEEKAVTTKRLEQVEELRSEVSYVQGLLGESRKAVNSEARDKADLQHRLETVAAEWAQQCDTIQGLQTQLEAVKAELVRQCENSRLLQIELDAREQVPQVVSERWEESYNKGAAQAVETIAEWTEPFRTCGSQGLSYHVMQNLPHIMRTLTGLTEED